MMKIGCWILNICFDIFYNWSKRFLIGPKKPFDHYSFVFFSFQELYKIYRTNQNKYSTFKHVHNRIGWWDAGKIRLRQFNTKSKKLCKNLNSSTELRRNASFSIKTNIKCGLKREREEKKESFYFCSVKNITIAIIKIWRCT